MLSAPSQADECNASPWMFMRNGGWGCYDSNVASLALSQYMCALVQYYDVVEDQS